MSEPLTVPPASVGELLMEVTVRLCASAEALAALTAHVRVQREGLEIDPELAASLADVSTLLLGTADVAAAGSAPQALGMARSLLRESLSLIEHPGRRGAWQTDDEVVLQGLGRLSMAIAGVFQTAAAHLDGLASALAAPSARFLDVGTGTGWLAIATARTFPGLQVTGIDVFDRALELARVNVTAEQLTDRVELAQLDVTDLAPQPAYDAIWLPLPFLPAAIVPDAVRRCADALRPGGWLLAGQFAGPDDAMALAATRLRTIRSGGRVWDPAEIGDLAVSAGLDAVHPLERTWSAPVSLVAARRPSAAPVAP